MQMRHKRLLIKFLVIIKMLKNFFSVHQKLIKKISEPKIEESIAERVKLKNNRIAEIKKIRKKHTMNCLKNTLLIIKAQVTCTKNYVIQKVKKIKIKYI